MFYFSFEKEIDKPESKVLPTWYLFNNIKSNCTSLFIEVVKSHVFFYFILLQERGKLSFLFLSQQSC